MPDLDNNKIYKPNSILNNHSNKDLIGPFYTNDKENFWKNKNSQINDIDYFEFDLKKINNLNFNSKNSNILGIDLLDTNI